jgi:isocitrate lyase
MSKKIMETLEISGIKWMLEYDESEFSEDYPYTVSYEFDDGYKRVRRVFETEAEAKKYIEGKFKELEREKRKEETEEEKAMLELITDLKTIPDIYSKTPETILKELRSEKRR